jgi:long-chain acyl-CoA synthetase
MTASAEDLPLQSFYRWERTQPDAIYLTQPTGGGAVRDWTWSQVGDQARRMAAYLRSRGWEPGSRISILSKNCAHWIMADLAIWMAGHVSVPLYPTLTAESVRQVLDHSGARACFIGKLDDWASMKDGIGDGVERICMPMSPQVAGATQWDDVVARTEPLPGNPVRGGDELATLIYTSGTTGTPKGVMHDFAGIAWAAKTFEQRFPASPADRVLSHLPLSHVAERWGVESTSFRGGFRIYFAESVETFAADLRRARPTVFGTVPRLWVKFQQGVFAKKPRDKLDRLLRIPLLGRVVRRKILEAMGLDQVRLALGGAAPMPPSLLDWYRRLGLPLLEAYGMTENFGCSHSNVPGRERVGSVGEPYPGVEQRISEGGEVEMRSPALMKGYFRDPEKTSEALTPDGWLRTGDLGEIDAQGRLRITGRAKELFKTSKGKYVAPSPIENRLTAHTGIEACCVMGASSAQPFAVAILSAEALKASADPAQRDSLRASFESHLAAINAQLDPHEQLDFLALSREAWTVENGFITPTLKVKRNVVEKHYEPRVARWAAQRAPVVWDG